MKKKEFVLLLKDYDKYQQNCSSMLKCGVDLFENTKYPVAEYAEKFFQIILNQNYTEFGVDWINWFVFENDLGRNNLEARDGSKLICQDVDGLYEYIKQYKKK